MKLDKNGLMTEATKYELYKVYLKKGFADLFPFDLYVERCKERGLKILDEVSK